MRKKKIMQLENNLVLSIQYARLKEEISDTENVLAEIKNKAQVKPINAVAKADDRKVVHSQEYIKNRKKNIEEIECKYSNKEYGIYQKPKFKEILSLLQKQSNSDIIKYQIAIRTILDNTCAYKNTDDFLENLSETLFNNKETIIKLKKKMIEIVSYISGTKEIDSKNGKVPALAKIPVVSKVAGKIPFLKKLTPLISKGALGFSLESVIVYTATGTINRKRLTKKIKRIMKNIDVDGFEFILYTNALCIWQAKQHMTELELQDYVSQKMNLINSFRVNISRELFEKMYNVKGNSKKLSLLNNFDKFLIENKIIS